MKTTVKVSISSIAFTIDEDAYQVLNNYLSTLKKHYGQRVDGKEIVEDIEARLAELLTMRVKSTEQVVTLDDANEVIRIMGNPLDLFEEETEDGAKHNNTTQNTTSKPSTPQVRKRLYRDPNRRIIAGVCGGLGNYFNLDPVIFRLLFVFCVLFFNAVVQFNYLSFLPFWGISINGLAILTYIVLWIAVPKAVTPQQKLEMMGNNPSIDDIEQRVRAEPKTSHGSNYTQNSWGFANFIVSIFRICFAIFLLFIGSVFIIGVIAAAIRVPFEFGFNLPEMLDVVGVGGIWTKTALAIVIIYPLAMLLYWGVKLLFRFKLRDKMIMVAAFVIWLVSLLYLIIYSVAYVAPDFKTYRNDSFYQETTTDITTRHDTLYINLAEEFADMPKINTIWGNWQVEAWTGEYNGMKSLFIIPDIRIRYRNDISNFQYVIRKEVYKRNREMPAVPFEESFNQLNSPFNDSILLIPAIVYNKEHSMKNSYEMYDVIIYAPEGKKVVIQEPLSGKSMESRERRSYRQRSWHYDD